MNKIDLALRIGLPVLLGASATLACGDTGPIFVETGNCDSLSTIQSNPDAAVGKHVELHGIATTIGQGLHRFHPMTSSEPSILVKDEDALVGGPTFNNSEVLAEGIVQDMNGQVVIPNGQVTGINIFNDSCLTDSDGVIK